MKLGEIIKEKRLELGMTMEDLANKSGLSKGYISMLEKGENPKTGKPIIPSIETFMGLAHALALDIDEMIGVIEPGQKISLASRGKISWEKTLAKNHEVKNLIPVLGRVQAGLPIEAVENIIGYEEISEEMARCGEFFALQIKGDSMQPRVMEGDVVIVKKQPDLESGEVGIVLINGEDATMKKVVKHESGITLISFNQAYPPKFFTSAEVDKLPVEILGRVVELRGKL